MASRPRIMRKRRVTEETVPAPPQPDVEEGRPDLLDDMGLEESGVYVHGGVMRRFQMPLHSHADSFELYHAKQRRITIEDSGANSFHSAIPYIENRLPGISDEVESYPCRFCTEKIFLTPCGLERHARAMHKEHLGEVMRQIRLISEEWKRRDVERTRIRERLQHTRSRQEALTVAAHKHFRASSGEFSVVISSEDLEMQDGQVDGMYMFESCSICHTQINSSHPTALEAHMRAHKKNDELRLHMLAEFGPEMVARLTCTLCRLVFTDDRKLQDHNDSLHTRKRRFICKWCGHMASSVTELNEHKVDVHAMPAQGGRVTAMSRRGLPGSSRLALHEHTTAMKKNEGARQQNHPLNDFPCKTRCSECGLQLSRPSLLVRHMLRVHSRVSFSARIDTRGMPSFEAHVECGRVTWTCCGRTHPDSISFGLHRRTEHLAKLGELLGERAPEPADISLSSVMDRPQGMIEVLMPEGVKGDDGGVYMLLVEDDGHGGQKQSVVKIENPQDDVLAGHVVVGELAEVSPEGAGPSNSHRYSQHSDYVLYMDEEEEEGDQEKRLGTMKGETEEEDKRERERVKEREEEEEETEEQSASSSMCNPDLDDNHFFEDDSQQEEDPIAPSM